VRHPLPAPSRARRTNRTRLPTSPLFAGPAAHAHTHARDHVPPRVPPDLTATIAFLAARAVPGLEHAHDGVYRRTLRLPHGHAVLELRPPGSRILVTDPRDRVSAEAARRRLLGSDETARAADAHLAADPHLAPLVAARPELRVPGTVDGGEIAIRAVLGQQVSVAAARTQAARLVERCGEPLPDPVGGVTHLFPAPDVLAALDPDGLPMPRARGRSLVTLAAALAGGLDPRDRAQLLELPGIGPWTADYVAMRCGDHDVLLDSDLGVRRGLARLGGAPDPERWRPWRSYAVMHLWGAA
jgi:AraC family transcriptional regulator of adaptative response / DNA-3-methyladenine glycosylase II